uniref:Opsin 6, group member a n=1 Tax=Neolamprologus brichardi TaxID=32507 RepID=A0A3Q4N6W4_NEOBR
MSLLHHHSFSQSVSWGLLGAALESQVLNQDQPLISPQISCRVRRYLQNTRYLHATHNMSLSGAAAGGPPWRNHSFILGGGRDPPLTDQGETIIGVYLLLLGWMSWFGNSIVLFVLYRQRASLLPTDYLTYNLAVSDASISVFGYSRGIIEIFNVFQDSGYLISSIWTCQVLTCQLRLGLWRDHHTLHQRIVNMLLPSHYITRTSVFVCLLLIWIAAGFWSGAPLLGWGSYTDRGYGTCEIDWAKANYSSVYKSYIVSIFVCCFFIPVLVMLFCYVSIINTVKRGNALSAEGDLTDRQRKIERDVTVVSIVICTAFILAWSPYAVVSMWSAWGFHVPNLTSIFTRLFAKSASFYNPLIYFGLSSKFRKDVAVLLPCTRDAKDTVKLKRFKPKADGRLATGGGARFKVHLSRPEKKYSLVNRPHEALTQDPGAGSPPSTPPPVNKEVFYIDMPRPSETGSGFECERL